MGDFSLLIGGARPTRERGGRKHPRLGLHLLVICIVSQATWTPSTDDRPYFARSGARAQCIFDSCGGICKPWLCYILSKILYINTKNIHIYNNTSILSTYYNSSCSLLFVICKVFRVEECRVIFLLFIRWAGRMGGLPWSNFHHHFNFSPTATTGGILLPYWMLNLKECWILFLLRISKQQLV